MNLSQGIAIADLNRVVVDMRDEAGECEGMACQVKNIDGVAVEACVVGLAGSTFHMPQQGLTVATHGEVGITGG